MRLGVRVGALTVALLVALALGYAWAVAEPRGAVAAGPVAAASSAPAPAAAPVDALRVLFATHGLRLGTAVDVTALRADPAYARRLAAEFSSLSGGATMRWSAVEPRRGTYDFAAADAVVTAARYANQTVHGPALVSARDLPRWVTDGRLSTAELRAALRTHVETMVRRWTGVVTSWDVVGEAVGPDGRLRDTLWLRRLGPGYLADAFRWARAADPRARLYLADGGAATGGPAADGLYDLLKRLRGQGVPVNGVAVAPPADRPAAGGWEAALRRLAGLRLELAVTGPDTRTAGTDRAAQVRASGRAVAACLELRRCVSVTVRGFAGDDPGAAALFTGDLRPGPAYPVVHRLLAASR